MRLPFCSSGDRGYLSKKILPLIPEHKVYVEPFAGSAAIFFAKEPSVTEVLNDADPEIAFALKFIQSITPEQIEDLKKRDWKVSKEKFYYLLNEFKPKTDTDRFYRFKYISRHSFNCDCTTFSGARANDSIGDYFSLMPIFKARLLGVKIYNKDYKEIIKEFDSPDTFFYLDPPYPGEWMPDENLWSESNIAELKQILDNIKGKFLLSLNNLDYVRQIFSKYNIRKVRRFVNSYLPGKRRMKYELLIANYEIAELSDEPSFLDKLEDITLVKDFICLVGSSVESTEYNDIDILIRLSEPTDYLKRAIETRLSKLFPSEKLHFIWGDPEGPHDDFIPLYDLKLQCLDFSKVEMGEDDLLLLKPLTPMKPSVKFYSANETAKYCANVSQIWAVEKKYNGYRAMIHKKGDIVKIYSEHGLDITSSFPTCVEQAKSLAISDFIIDCEIVAYENDLPLGRSELAKYIGAAKSSKIISDKSIRFYVFDCIYYGSDKRLQKWVDRQKILSQMKFTSNIRKVEPLIATGEEELYKAIRIVSNLAGSEGAVLKQYDSPYVLSEKSSYWVKYRKLLPLRVIVLKVNETDNAFNYTVGIQIVKQIVGKFDDKHIVKLGNKHYLILGNTFNTKIKAEKLDILDIQLEEVWRHRLKSDKIYYSIHKPHVIAISDYKITDNIQLLDEYVVSRGEEVTEENESSEQFEIEPLDDDFCSLGPILFNCETSEMYEAFNIKNFPKEMQDDFLNVKDWSDFVVQWHYRGHEIPEDDKGGDISKFYQYKLDSIHTDWRFKVDSHLQGFTLFTPGSAIKAYEDKVNENMANVRATIKVPQPLTWLTFEGIAPKGEPGSTSGAPALFVIVAKGKFRTVLAEDHRIIVELKPDSGNVNLGLIDLAKKDGIYVKRLPPEKLKQLPRKVSFHIAHIGNRHLILADAVDTNEKDRHGENRQDN